MAPEPARHRVGTELKDDTFGVKRVVFSVGAMSGTTRRILRKRLRSELDAVRDLSRKAEFFTGGGTSGEAGAAGPGEDGGFTAAEPHPEAPMEVDGSSEAKRRKVPPLVQRTEEQKRTTTADERARLAERLASLAAALPDHVVEFLENQRTGDADYRGDGSETETGMKSMKDGAMFQFKLWLDKFAPANTPKNHGRTALDASSASCLSNHRRHHHHHQDASGKTGAADKGEDDVDICGGASRRIQLRDVAEEYDELVGDIGVVLLSPLQRKYVDLAGHDEYVDICGDASHVAFPAAEAGEIFCSPSSSSSGSGASSSDSKDTSSSGSEDTSSSDSDDTSSTSSDSDENVGNPVPPPDFRKEGSSCKQAAQPPKPAPEKVQIAEPEEIQQQCAAATTPTMRPITSSPPAPLVLTEAEESDNIWDAEHNGIVEPEEPHGASAAADDPLTDLIAKAQGAIERRRQEERNRAREEARRELLEVERAALPDERIHPLDMEMLGLAAFEHVVSTVSGASARTAGPTGENGRPTVMQFPGLFPQADGGSDSEEQEQRPGVATSGADIDVDEGEIW